jgi:hypothetical protein
VFRNVARYALLLAPLADAPPDPLEYLLLDCKVSSFLAKPIAASISTSLRSGTALDKAETAAHPAAKA